MSRAKKKASLTQERLEVYSFLSNIILKIVIAFSMLVAFFWVLTYVICYASVDDKWKFIFLDAVLAHTIYRIIAHYFPTQNKTASQSSPESLKEEGSI